MATIPASPCLRSRRPLQPPVAPRLSGRTTVVSIVGDLDGASGEHWYHACTAATGSDVRVDLSATTSIDDDGYSALAAARRAVGARGGTFTLQGTSGTLAQLLRTLRALREEAAGRPAHPDQHCTRAPRRSRGG